MKLIKITLFFLLTIMTAAYTQEAAKSADTSKNDEVKKESEQSRYKDMKALQILEEARKGKQAEIAAEMANQKDFVLSQKIVMAMAYF